VKAVCTISSVSHVYKAAAMLTSCKAQHNDLLLFILLVDGEGMKEQLKKEFAQFKFLSANDFVEADARRIFQKYDTAPDALRWSLKPVLLKKLITDFNIDKALYCDNDIYFFNPFHFLFEGLDKSDILLFPHWRLSDPRIDPPWFETNFKDGIFNGGSIAVNSKAIKFLDWWAACCLYRCEVNFSEGFYVDQKYLDIVPVLFENSSIIRHKGCNMAYWNIRTISREMKNNQVMLDGKFPVVFVHFTNDYIRALNEDEDPLMKPFLEEYELALTKFEPQQINSAK
jgi:hypothetical protein